MRVRVGVSSWKLTQPRVVPLAQPLDPLRQQLLWFQPKPTAGEVGRRPERDPSLLRPAQDISAENRGGKSDLGYISHQISLQRAAEQTLRLARDARTRAAHLAGGGSEWSSSPWPRSSLRFFSVWAVTPAAARGE
jgi:hypothetical protein